MKKFLAIILSLGFVGSAVFGLLGMNWGHHLAQGGCVIGAFAGQACPAAIDFWDFVLWHLHNFKSFFAVTIPIAWLFVLGLGILFSIVFGRGLILLWSDNLRWRRYGWGWALSYHRQELWRYLAFLAARQKISA